MDDSNRISEQDQTIDAPPEMPGRSTLGTVSLGLGLLAVMFILGCCVLAFVYFFPNLYLEQGFYLTLIFLGVGLIVLIGIVSLAGIITGVISSVRKEPRISFSVTGTIVSGLGLVTSCLLLLVISCLLVFALSRFGGY